jgi:hypothetical protein
MYCTFISILCQRRKGEEVEGGGGMAFDHNVFPDGRFSGLLSSFLTTFVMMIGEFEYKELFNQVS